MTAVNDFTSDITLSVTNPPTGVMTEFYDPNAPVQGPGSSPITVSLYSVSTDTVTLTVCVDPSTPVGSYALTVQGVSGGLTHTQTLGLTVTGAPPTGGTPTHGSALTVPGGIGRKIETTSSIFSGLSASITLPNSANLVQCNNSDDSAYVYSGGAVTGSAMDAGLQLGHTGNASWKSYIADSGGGSYVDKTGALLNPPPAPILVSGSATIRFEAPGYQRQAGEPALGAPIVVNGVVQSGYIILSINGQEFYWEDPRWGTNSANVKRCSTLAQNVPTINKVEVGNGAGGGFNVNGSTVLNGAWNNVLLFDQADPAGRSFFGFDYTYPGAPYVGWSSSGFHKYDNENGIDLSTVPLPASDTPNPQ